MPLDPLRNLRLQRLSKKSVSLSYVRAWCDTPFLFATETTAHLCDLGIIICENERRWKDRSCRLIFFATNK